MLHYNNMFGRLHMAGLNEFWQRFVRKGASLKLSPAWYCSSLGGSEKAGKRICADPRIYYYKQLNTLIVTPII